MRTLNRASSSSALIGLMALGGVAAIDPASAAGKCELKAVQVPLVYEDGRLLVAATIDGHPAHMVVDSGASRSLIFRGAAAAFGKEIVGEQGKAYTAGGIESPGRVTVHDFNLAGFVVAAPVRCRPNTVLDYFDATDMDNGWPVGLSATTRNFALSV